MKKVVLASFAKFPDGDSNAVHFYNIGSIFLQLGFEVSFVGFGNQDGESKVGKFFSLKSHSRFKFLNKLLSHFRMDNKLLKFLFEHFYDVDVVLLAGCLGKRSLIKLKRFYKKHSPSTKLLLSMTEEYTRDEFDKFNYFTKRGFKRNQYLNNDFNDTDFKMICISKYLYKKYCSKGFASIYLPFVFLQSQIGNIKQLEHEKIEYIYVGSPDNKDMLFEILKSFSLLDKRYKNRIKVNIVGVDKKWVYNRDSVLLPEIDSFVNFCGRLKRDDAIKYYKTADYSLLLRDETKIFAKAGCSTKIIESLFYAVPPITNYSGDLEDFLLDLDNSIISAGHSIESFKDAIIKSIDNYHLHKKMSNKALLTAKSKFEASNYASSMKEFVFDE